jgi:hypothetical protein
VLDAEHATRAPDGRWFLLCQRGLFMSRDNGVSWHYQKPKLPHGAHHYGEFRTMAVAGETLFLGTKGGLFSARLADPEHLAPVAGLAAAPVEALAAGAGDALVIGIEGQGLATLDPATGAMTPLSDVAMHETRIVADGARLLAASEQRVLAIGETVAEAAPDGAAGELGIAGDSATTVLWDRERGWVKRAGEDAWHVLAAWPARARSAAVVGRRVVVTDRARILGLTLPDAA